MLILFQWQHFFLFCICQNQLDTISYRHSTIKIYYISVNSLVSIQLSWHDFNIFWFCLVLSINSRKLWYRTITTQRIWARWWYYLVNTFYFQFAILFEKTNIIYQINWIEGHMFFSSEISFFDLWQILTVKNMFCLFTISKLKRV